MDKYNLEYKGVICTGADWEKDPYEFELTYKGKVYLYKQKRYISQSADTDHIRCVIKQFLEDVPPRTQFERIKAMSIDEMAEFFARRKKPDFPPSPCYVCEFDRAAVCINMNNCDEAHKAKVYKEWLESEVSE